MPGETALAFYTAKNPTSRPVTGISTYNVLPYESGPYFNKIQCFCFEEQQLDPHEEVTCTISTHLLPISASFANWHSFSIRRLICQYSSSSILHLLMIQKWKMSTRSCYPTPFSKQKMHQIYNFPTTPRRIRSFSDCICECYLNVNYS